MSTQALSQPFAKINLTHLPRMSLRKFLLFGFVIITSLLIFYIYQISEIAGDVFFISKYQQEIAGLSQDNKNLEISIARNNALSNLETIFKRLNYEKVDRVYYIQTLDKEMAVK